jgi:hypothetical protein
MGAIRTYYLASTSTHRVRNQPRTCNVLITEVPRQWPYQTERSPGARRRRSPRWHPRPAGPRQTASPRRSPTAPRGPAPRTTPQVGGVRRRECRGSGSTPHRLPAGPDPGEPGPAATERRRDVGPPRPPRRPVASSWQTGSGAARPVDRRGPGRFQRLPARPRRSPPGPRPSTGQRLPPRREASRRCVVLLHDPQRCDPRVGRGRRPERLPRSGRLPGRGTAGPPSAPRTPARSRNFRVRTGTRPERLPARPWCPPGPRPAARLPAGPGSSPSRLAQRRTAPW